MSRHLIPRADRVEAHTLGWRCPCGPQLRIHPTVELLTGNAVACEWVHRPLTEPDGKEPRCSL